MKKNIMKVVSKAKFKHLPGEHHYYSSMDTEILGLILEKATGMPLTEFLENEIWKPCGMESPATWDMDSKKHGHTKSFCCLKATARDFAKFGRLYLNKGNWNGHQIIDEEWVNKSIIPAYENNCYQYQWYSTRNGFKMKKNENGTLKHIEYKDSISASKDIVNPNFERALKLKNKDKWVIKKCGPSFFALGIFGQEIYVNPETNTIFVRLGKKWDTPNQNLFLTIENELLKI